MDVQNKYSGGKPSIIIDDDDESFLDDGMVVMAMREEQFMEFLSKLTPEIADEVLSEYYKANYGIHCNIVYHSNRKKVICPTCGRIVSLT